jgi:hypothetical protein
MQRWHFRASRPLGDAIPDGTLTSKLRKNPAPAPFRRELLRSLKLHYNKRQLFTVLYNVL